MGIRLFAKLEMLPARASTTEQHADAFRIVALGHTGVGKSTFIDVLAGGRELAKVGTASGDSQTESTVAYRFKALNSSWVIVDTPGVEDTGGNDVTNQDQIQCSLQRVGSVDAVVLVWRSDVKFTKGAMAAWLFLRSYFGPDVWKKMIIVYTFWQWQECFPTPVAGKVQCLRCMERSALEQLHKKTMDAAFKYISSSLGTGDERCVNASQQSCFPQPEHIPYIGSDLYLENIKRWHKLGWDLLSPSCPYYGCRPAIPSGPEELNRFVGFLKDMKRHPEHAINTTGLSNAWLECTRTARGVKAMKEEGFVNADNDAKVAAHLENCFRGRIFSLIRHITDELLGTPHIQARLAFSMSTTTFLTPEMGFDKFDKSVLEVYPNYATYHACLRALEASPINPKAQVRCWNGLHNGSLQRPLVRDAIDDLRRVVQCTCSDAGSVAHNAFTCTVPALNGHCAVDELCSSPESWNFGRGCELAPKCRPADCPSPVLVMKSTLPDFCNGPACLQDECCDTADMCDSYTCPYGWLKMDNPQSYCGSTSCTVEQCCDRRGQCSDFNCPEGYSLTDGDVYCESRKCSYGECCSLIPTPAPTPSPTPPPCGDFSGVYLNRDSGNSIIVDQHGCSIEAFSKDFNARGYGVGNLLIITHPRGWAPGLLLPNFDVSFSDGGYWEYLYSGYGTGGKSSRS